MRKIAEILLQLYVFTIPWESVANAPGLGPLARLAGMAAVGGAAATILVEGKFRRPDKILVLSAAFVILSAVSLSWTISETETQQAVVTYAQLLLSLWVLREVARTPEQQRRLLTVFCLGLYVPLVTFAANFAVTGGAPTATFSIGMPNAPVFAGIQLVTQALSPDPVLNALGLRFSNAGRMTIGL